MKKLVPPREFGERRRQGMTLSQHGSENGSGHEKKLKLEPLPPLREFMKYLWAPQQAHLKEGVRRTQPQQKHHLHGSENGSGHQINFSSLFFVKVISLPLRFVKDGIFVWAELSREIRKINRPVGLVLEGIETFVTNSKIVGDIEQPNPTHGK